MIIRPNDSDGKVSAHLARSRAFTTGKHEIRGPLLGNGLVLCQPNKDALIGSVPVDYALAHNINIEYPPNTAHNLAWLQ